MVRESETIKCSKCGFDSGIPLNGPSMRVIPPEGIKCFCGRILVYGSKIELGGEDYQNWSRYSFKYVVDPNEGNDRYLSKDLGCQLYC